MVVSFVIGVILLAIIIYTLIRIVKNILLGIALIGIVLLISYFILGSMPNLKETPIIGSKLPKIPASINEFFSVLKKFFFNLKILEVSRDSKNQILITVQNTGKFKLSNFSVFIDEKRVNIINKPTDPLDPNEITTLQTDWDKNFTQIIIQTSKVNVTFPG